MNTYVTLACLLAVLGLSHASAIGSLGYGHGYGVISAPILAPAAISTANQWRAAPIPVVRTVLTAPIIRTVPVVKTIAPVGLGWNGLGWNGLGWNGLGWNGGWNGLGHGIHG